MKLYNGNNIFYVYLEIIVQGGFFYKNWAQTSSYRYINLEKREAILSLRDFGKLSEKLLLLLRNNNITVKYIGNLSFGLFLLRAIDQVILPLFNPIVLHSKMACFVNNLDLGIF